MSSMTAAKFLPLGSSVTSVTIINFTSIIYDTTWEDYPISQHHIISLLNGVLEMIQGKEIWYYGSYLSIPPSLVYQCLVYFILKNH